MGDSRAAGFCECGKCIGQYNRALEELEGEVGIEGMAAQARAEPTFPNKPVNVFVLRWIAERVGGDASSLFGISPAGVLYGRMLEAKGAVELRRAENARLNSPEAAAERRAARALAHQERLKLKAARDAARKLEL